ncbi:MAG: NAD(P)H-hydrate dehydratase [Pacificimonas sp.]|nr:NAD(P)H-hydrate dehydratase [Pacificimonas sp.]
MKRDPVLTAAEMKAAEESVARSEDDLWQLMLTAGQRAAEHIAIRAGSRPILVLCGPGNNGGDGSVAAVRLREMGCDIRLAELMPPMSAMARRARALWTGPVEAAAEASARPVFVDAGFGSGQSRPLSPDHRLQLGRLANDAELTIALDLISGTGCDDGADLGAPYRAAETLVFGAWKPAHVLEPAAAMAGRLRLVDFGIGTPASKLHRNAPPTPVAKAEHAHKYERGSVLVALGAMPGAGYLAAKAAQRGGAGYVTVTGESDAIGPGSLVVKAYPALERGRLDALVVGPGLGTDDAASEALGKLLSLTLPTVLDADALALLTPDTVPGGAVLTPHEGEFERFFGTLEGSKIERARAAAKRAKAVICLKGRDTVIAAPDGEAVVNTHAHRRLATAGSGDVLAGLIGAELASGREPFEAACAAVWRHGDAGIRGRDGLIAEDLLSLLRA